MFIPPEEIDLNSVQILWADLCTPKYSPIPLNKVTETKDLKVLLNIWDIGALMRPADSLERTKERGKKKN